MNTRGAFASVAMFGLVAAGCADEPPLDVAKVDLDRFEGGYFEIAKLPRPTQADCFGTTSFHQRIGRRELAVTHECHEGALDGPLRRVTARAAVDDPDEPAKLSVDFGGFYGDYWIVEVAEDYRYAVIGHPSRAYLWILSRTAGMDQADLDVVTARALEQGFATNRLEFTDQGPDATRVAPSAPSSNAKWVSSEGCSVAPRAPRAPRDGGAFALMGLAVVAIFGARRVQRAQREGVSRSRLLARSETRLP